MGAAAQETGKIARKLAGTKVGIPPRQLNFRMPEQAPRYFYAGNGTATAFFAVLSAIFPPGEDFFVESVRRFRDRIDDPELKARVAGFIGQEAIHGREHERLNEMLSEQGFDIEVPDRAIRAGLWLLEQLPHRQQLACTAMMEHFTALLGEQLLTDEEFSERADPEMIQLWYWHALEELEHKAVCYDVYENLGNSPAERVLTFPYVAGALLPAILGSWGYLVAHNGLWRKPSDMRQGLKMLLGKDGFVTRIMPRMGAYAKKDFHPDKHDTEALVRQWRDKLFGENGTLSADVKNLEVATV